MPYITVYTIHCPACIILEKKLQAKGLLYSVIDDEKTLQELGIEQFPQMSVNCGPRMTYKEAVAWINSLNKGDKSNG